MSEVKKWYIGVYGGEAQARPCSPAEFEIINEREGRYFVLKEDFDRVTAERDAPQARLTAADERADVLEGLLREALPALYLAAGAFKSVKPIHNKVRAALKPVEGGGDEPNCLLCLDKKTVPSSLAKGYVMDCPDCCGEEG